MSDKTLPAPLVPPECDLRSFPEMRFDVGRLLNSETWVLGTGDERAAAFALWAQSWHQLPAGSLPNEQRMLEHLSMSKRWKAVRAHSLRGWIACDDDRLYHPVVCARALEAWIEKLMAGLSGAIGNAKRWNVEIDIAAQRAQFVDAVERLRALDPKSRTLTKKAVLQHLAAAGKASPPDADGGSPPDDSGGSGDTGNQSPPDSPPESGPESPPDVVPIATDVDVDADAEKKPAALRPPPPPAPAHEPARATHAREGEPPPEAEGFKPTPAGAVCKAMREAGLQQTNPGDPRLLALLAQGATVEEFSGIAAEAAGHQPPKGFAWVLTVLQSRRAEAAQIALAQPVQPQPKPGELSGRQPLFVPPPPLTEAERAAADAKRREVMAQHRQRRGATT